MPTLTFPWTFVNGTPADATQVNADFNSVQTVVNGLDNANVGVNGFFASQIIPTSGTTAQFGGAFGYTFSMSGQPAQTPLTLKAASVPTADIFDVFAGATKLAWIDNAGNFFTTAAVNASGGISVTGNGQVTGALNVGPAIIASTAGDANFGRNATQGQIAIGGATSSAVLDWNITTANWLTINKQTKILNAGINGFTVVPAADNTAAVLNVFNAGQTQSMFRVDDLSATSSVAFVYKGALCPLMPGITAAGGALANSFHAVSGTITAAGASTAIAFAGGAVFTGNLVILVYDSTAASLVTSGFTGVSGSGFTFPSTSGHIYNYFAVGI